MLRGALVILSLFFAAIGSAVGQQGQLECVYVSSDPDGDGFGFENNTTCLITENSRGEIPSSNECVDDNADGWGWNGVESCEVPIPVTDCIDTDPIGDGWGWDGVTSCRVGSIAQQPFDELKEIEKHFIDVAETRRDGSTRAAVISCPGSLGPYYLKYSGSLYAVGADKGGLWSSGVSNSDHLLRLGLSSSLQGIFYIVLLINEDGVWEGGQQQDEHRCQWLTSG